MSDVILFGSLTVTTALGLVAKVTLLLLLAWTLTALLRRKSAAARHFVWALALTSTVVLTLITPFAPVLPLHVVSRAETPNVVTNARTIRAEAPPAVGRVTVNDDAGAQPISAAMPSFQNIVFGAWLLGAAAVFAWLLLGHVGLRRLTRASVPVRDNEWLTQLVAARAAMGVSRDVYLCRSTVVGAPITWGFRRPVVVLPIEAFDWSEERRRVVLQHELAHIARNDYVLQLIGGAALALYWFHPAMWLAARRLRRESERACDDAVLSRGTMPADYASHLLSVARGARALRLARPLAIGMARRSELEGRLLAALDESVPRAPLSSGIRMLSTGALGVVLLPFAGMRPVERSVVISQNVTTATDSTFERSVPASPGERLELDLGPGGDVDIRGWDEPRVRVSVMLGGLNWRDVTVEIGRVANGVLVRSRYDRKRNSQSTENRYEIRVPRRFDVRLSSGGGDLTILDVEGEFSGTSGGGEIVLERLRGRASLSTGGGDIRVADVDLDGSVRTGGGMVTMSRVSGSLRGHSGSGPVIYGIKPNATNERDEKADLRAYNVEKGGKRVTVNAEGRSTSMLHISKAGGDIVLEEAPAGAVISTGGGEVRVGRSAGLVDASTGGGDVTIGPVAGSVRAGTGAGTVHVMLADARAEEQSVEIHAGVGRVILELPPNFEGSFEIETAYTRNFGRATRIESDWELERETTDEWDSRQGTPRRYVRAQGVLGRGRNRVFIKTTNGDIELRRRR